MKLRVSDLIVKFLEAINVNFVFGIPGSQTCPFYDSLYSSSSIRHVLVKHEQSASYMADAYAKLTGKIGVCDGTGGPGATNLLTGIATAWTDSTPVMVFTGQQPLNYLGKGAFQEINHVAIFSPITKWSTMLVKAERTLEILREALKAATWGRPGPVHLDLPLDVQNQYIDFDERLCREAVRLLHPPNPCGAPQAVDKALRLLINSFRPVIIAGGGLHYSSRACKELREFAECLDVPVATTFNGRGSFPEDHPLSAGRMGVHAPSFNDEILARADLIFAIGCRFAALSTRYWSNINPAAKLIHVDVDPEVIEINYPVEVGIIGDARKVLKKMLERAEGLRDLGKERRREWLNFIGQAKERWRKSPYFAKSLSRDSPIKPQRACAEIRKACDRKTIFTLDAGNNKLWASTFLEIYEPYTWIQSGCFGPMGYAIPAAIACRLAVGERGRSVVAICGDGGFYMSLHELSTSLQEEAPILVCVFNDGALGTIKHSQRDLYGGRFISVDLKNPSFAKVAESFGCHGLSVERVSQLEPALKDGLEMVKNGETAVIDIKIDGEEPLPP